MKCKKKKLRERALKKMSLNYARNAFRGGEEFHCYS